ncbi:paired mesoderm homeobox protein 2a [Chrysochromulina tobinii]|uniref:Paired mesoderm homeobox protein 2a n=1 Tax=Chrysochromulina tobinii TaxID=1460289 RepID=A0A0M0JSP1_9EUKA|nr:paired mesoderm homeobox protein 2a [Chrysochromulina tobinii]|eukprot:KOO29666.1 paired mesoderm homeobox protein 2a [Chrysochromulina sp. CCMP291]
MASGLAAPNYGMAPCGRVRVQPASPQLLSAVDNPSSTIGGRWIISSSALYLLEQVYKIENYPSLHMRQRLATDLEVSQRQIQVWFQNRRQRDRNLIKASEKLSPKMESSGLRPSDASRSAKDGDESMEKDEASDHCDAGSDASGASHSRAKKAPCASDKTPTSGHSSTPSSLASPSPELSPPSSPGLLSEHSHSRKTVPSLQMAPPTARPWQTLGLLPLMPQPMGNRSSAAHASAHHGAGPSSSSAERATHAERGVARAGAGQSFRPSLASMPAPPLPGVPSWGAPPPQAGIGGSARPSARPSLLTQGLGLEPSVAAALPNVAVYLQHIERLQSAYLRLGSGVNAPSLEGEAPPLPQPSKAAHSTHPLPRLPSSSVAASPMPLPTNPPFFATALGTPLFDLPLSQGIPGLWGGYPPPALSLDPSVFYNLHMSDLSAHVLRAHTAALSQAFSAPPLSIPPLSIPPLSSLPLSSLPLSSPPMATGTAMPAPTASSSFPFQRSSSTMDDAPELGKCFKKPRSNTDPFPQSYARATSVDATSATTFEQPSTETSAIGSDYGTNSNDLNVDQAFDWRGANSMMDLDMDLIMGMAGVVDSKVAVV